MYRCVLEGLYMSEKIQMSYHIELWCSTIMYAEATCIGATAAKCIGQ